MYFIIHDIIKKIFLATIWQIGEKMSKQRVLIQDIAEALNLSRTTVSKALNGSGKVSEKNKEKILKKAAELNYKYFSLLPTVSAPTTSEEDSNTNNEGNIKGNIAFFFHKTPDKQHIAYSLLISFEQEIRAAGYTLSLYSITQEEIDKKVFPSTFLLQQTSAIMCMELFDRNYCKMLSHLNIPVLFIDSYYKAIEDHLSADILLMECRYSLEALMKKIIITHHVKSAGFVGTYSHCLSFYERWIGFSMTLQNCNIPLDLDMCIIAETDEMYWDKQWFPHKLKMMRFMPQLFVCANDSLAISLINQLKNINFRIPEDVMVIGFDNSPASQFTTPPLTTIDSNSSELGIAAAQQLLLRLQNPHTPYIRSFLQSKSIIRESAPLPNNSSSF